MHARYVTVSNFSKLRIFEELFELKSSGKNHVINDVSGKSPPGSSVGWVPDCRAGGRGFESWPDQYLILKD